MVVHDQENTGTPILVIYSTLRGFFPGVPVFTNYFGFAMVQSDF